MNVNCSTCLELLIPSDEISCTPCGHIFHTKCIQEWMRTGKSNCPQCRTKCLKTHLRRIYFTEAMDATMNTQDTCALNSRVDSLTFDVRILKKEKMEAIEERDTEMARSVALKDEVRSLEVRCSSAKEETLSYKAQNRLLQGEKRKADQAMKEAQELRDKLNLFKNIELAVNGSETQVRHKMHQMGDFSKAAKEMSYMVETLKTELEKGSKELSTVRKEINHKNLELDRVRSECRDFKKQYGIMTSENSRLTSDNKHLEDEVASLKSKLKSLQDAMDSPSGDVRTSAINRLIQESPAPAPIKRPVHNDENDIFTTPDLKRAKIHPKMVLSPLARSVSECGIVGLKKTKSIKDSTNIWKSQISTQSTKSSSLSNGVKIDDLESPKGTFYNGFGGHSRPDPFPTSRDELSKVNGKKTSKKPKGVSRPKPKASDSSRPIDAFFSALIEDD